MLQSSELSPLPFVFLISSLTHFILSGYLSIANRYSQICCFDSPFVSLVVFFIHILLKVDIFSFDNIHSFCSKMAIPCTHFITSKNSTLENGILMGSSPLISPSMPPKILTQEELKKIAAYKAVEYVDSNMVIGLGTGSTAKHAVDRIGELLHQGKLKNIIGIPTSKKTHEQAVSLGIPLSDLDSYPVVDLAIDGADEVDPYLNLVKGRGGSLLREKMIEGACKKFVVIVDESKLVKHLGGSGLAMPVEIVPFCWKFTAEKLKKLFADAGCLAKLRAFPENGEPFVTDNGNYVVDLYFNKDIGDLKKASDAILRLPGVVEHGMFIDMATTVIIAGELGVTIKNK